MGCTSEKTKDVIIEEGNYPVCRLSIDINAEFDCMIAYDSKRIILGGKDKIDIFDLSTKEVSSLSTDIKGRINCLTKIPDGKVVSGGQDSKLKVWDIDKKECLYILEGHKSIIWDIKYLSEDKLISASDDNTSKIWNLKDKTSKILYSAKRHISCIAVLKNNRVLLAAAKNVLLFDLETKDQISCLDITVWSLKILKDGEIAAGLGNGLLYILEVTDEIIVKTKFARGHKTNINFIIELNNGKIVTCSDDENLILWDRNDPESVYFIKGHTDIVTSMCYIEGNKFASFSKDNTLKIWE